MYKLNVQIVLYLNKNKNDLKFKKIFKISQYNKYK